MEGPPMEALLQVIEVVGNAGILIFVVAGMLALGLSLTVRQIVDPLGNPRVPAMLLLGNFVLVPGLAYLLQTLIPLEAGFDVGLLLLATAAGAPFLPKLVELAKGSVASSVGAMILLMVVTIGYLPLVLPLLLPGVAINPLQIAMPLVLFMLIPLAAGLIAKRRLPAFAQCWQPVLARLSSVGLIVGFLALLTVNVNALLLAAGNGALLVAALLIVGAFLIGWLLAGGRRELRTVLALGTAQRNLSAALVVAGTNFSDPNVVVMVMVGAVLMLGGLMGTAAALGRRAQDVQTVQGR